MGSDKDSAITVEVDDRLDVLFGDEGEQEDSFIDKGAHAGDRLGSFVGEGDAINDNSESGNMSDSGSALIQELKSVVLSLEWEITDQVMQKLGEEIERLKDACKEDKIVIAFLQLLDSLGKYIQKKKAESHPDSISLLNDVYENLEKVMLSGKLGDSEKKKMLVAQVNRYKELKKDIASSKPAVSRRTEERQAERAMHDEPDEEPVPEEESSAASTVPPFVSFSDQDIVVEDDESSPSGIASDQDIVRALKEINKTIKNEFKALREELRLWRESQ